MNSDSSLVSTSFARRRIDRHSNNHRAYCRSGNKSSSSSFGHNRAPRIMEAGQPTQGHGERWGDDGRSLNSNWRPYDPRGAVPPRAGGGRDSFNGAPQHPPPPFRNNDPMHVPLKKRKRFSVKNDNNYPRDQQCPRFGDNTRSTDLASSSRPVDPRRAPGRYNAVNSSGSPPLAPNSFPQGSSEERQNISGEKPAAAPWVEHSPPHALSCGTMNSAIRPLAPRLSSSSYEDDSKAAVVSDGQAPDLFETSTAGSSCLSLDNASAPTNKATGMVKVGGGKLLPDIPRQIETPTKSLLHPELEGKIPRKSKSFVKSIKQANEEIETKSSVGCVTAAESNGTVSAPSAPPKTMEEWIPSPRNLKIRIHRKKGSERRDDAESPNNSEKTATSSDDSRLETAVSTEQTSNKRAGNAEYQCTVQDPRLQSDAFKPSPAKIVPTNISTEPQVTPAAESPPPKKLSPAALRRKKNYLRVQIGSRVSVFWDGESAYFHATVTRERPHKKKRFYLEYDDGDCEWINLRKEKWRLLSGGKDIFEDASGSVPTPATAAEPKSQATADVKSPSQPFDEPKTNNDLQIDELAENPINGENLVGEASGEAGFNQTLAFVPSASTEVTAVSQVAEPTGVSDVPQVDEPVLVKKKKKSKKSRRGFAVADWIHDDEWVKKAANKSVSDSETDDEEVMQFARHMLGVEKPSVARPKKKNKKLETQVDSEHRPEKKPEPAVEPDFRWEELEMADIHIPISEKVKMGRRRSRADAPDNSELVRSEKKKKKRKVSLECRVVERTKSDGVETDCTESRTVKSNVLEPQYQVVDPDEATRRKKEEARTLTAEEIRAILGEDDDPCGTSKHWVRRSARMPSASVLNTPRFKQLIYKLKANDPDMVVLKMKKYLSDPDCPQVCIDTVLDALEENTNCQSLYIQNFNEGMRDKQVLRLIEILKKPSCNIWCLNIGETYKVKTRTWKAFTRGLKDTKITHMYASEHTISSELKDKIRSTIRENRKKHNMHIDPENLDVIVKCTHCWWNPINAKVLRPHLHRKGYTHILNDIEAQGLRGTESGAVLKRNL
mmetsp:Transcript_14209/g.27194  ORF Transcript_14209/g.27194 Transcript_14209/m.27194 type:complete len:1061 (-) Transcript_14209:126-3308(-)